MLKVPRGGKGGKKGSVNGVSIFSLFSSVGFAMPIEQVGEVSVRPHVEMLGDPRGGHRCLRPHFCRQPHLEDVPFASLFEVFHRPAFFALRLIYQLLRLRLGDSISSSP